MGSDRTRRWLAIMAGSAAVLILGTALWISFMVVHSGLVTVQVEDHESGFSIFLPVPGILVVQCSQLLPLVVDGDELEQFRTEAGLQEWAPMVIETLRAFEDIPSAPLVVVEERDSTVRIAKRRGSVTVDVEAPDATVRVSVPLRVVRRSLENLIG